MKTGRNNRPLVEAGLLAWGFAIINFAVAPLLWWLTIPILAPFVAGCVWLVSLMVEWF